MEKDTSVADRLARMKVKYVLFYVASSIFFLSFLFNGNVTKFQVKIEERNALLNPMFSGG